MFKPGTKVVLRYSMAKVARLPDAFPHHGETGTVLVRGRGPGPRNCTVQLDGGAKVVVPWRNLRRVGRTRSKRRGRCPR